MPLATEGRRSTYVPGRRSSKGRRETTEGEGVGIIGLGVTGGQSDRAEGPPRTDNP
jgi:hypothetical protein